jgi:glutathione S-transferase
VLYALVYERKSLANLRKEFSEIDITEFPALQIWHERMASRPAVQKGYNVPSGADLNSVLEEPEKLKQLLAGNKAWIAKGLKQDAQK